MSCNSSNQQNLDKSLQTVAPYTSLDDDISSKNPAEKVNYSYYILSMPDPSQNQQINKGISALNTVRNPVNLMSAFRDWKKFNVLISAICALFVLVAIGAFLMVFMYHTIMQQPSNYVTREVMMACGPVIVGIIIIIVLLQLLYGRILKEFMRAYYMLPVTLDKKTTQESCEPDKILQALQI